MKIRPRIMTPTDSYVVVYPEFVKMADTQFEDARWTANEIAVEKDKQDMLVNVNPAARHAITTGLKLFTRYEMYAGKEYWLNRVIKAFPRPEVERMASVFGMFELHVHAPFYNKLNEVLGLDTDEFYTSYVDDPVLNARVEHLDEIVDDTDDLVSVGMFSIMEGAVLFGLFSMFKSFQSNGNNKIGNSVGGINQSSVDEGLHQIGGATLFNRAMDEIKAEDRDYHRVYFKIVSERVLEGARKLAEHEFRIIDMLAEQGDIGTGWNAQDAKQFSMSRINICLSDLGIAPLFTKEEIGANPIAGWYYDGIQKYVMGDFFVRQGREYTSHWVESDFEWPDDEEDVNE